MKHQNEKIKILELLENQDECSYLTDLALVNKHINRHAFLLRCGWRMMGSTSVGWWPYIKRTVFYANLDMFDNPCCTFNQTEAWFITLWVLARTKGVKLTYSKGWGNIPWYERVRNNHFKVLEDRS